MTIGYDQAASAGQYVYSPQPYAGHVDLRFYVSIEADYVAWGRVSADSYGTDSFWVVVDGGPQALWDIPIGPWTWSPVTDRSAGIQKYHLVPGWHQVRVLAREPGARLDTLELRRSGGMPTPSRCFLYLPAVLKK